MFGNDYVAGCRECGGGIGGYFNQLCIVYECICNFISNDGGGSWFTAIDCSEGEGCGLRSFNTRRSMNVDLEDHVYGSAVFV
mmetsp:Transcript_29034/g.34515  ORF Transcript_29034/g.34515 Transcript_29034/m.34515 type:complete len:82 (+) Transcript_29034:1868-2113(+)